MPRNRNKEPEFPALDAIDELDFVAMDEVAPLDPSWTLVEGLVWVRLIYPTAIRAGFNLHIGGSLMYQGKSNKDLDIVGLRRPQVLDVSHDSVIREAAELGFDHMHVETKIPFRVIHKLRARKTGQFVDLIMLDLPGQTHEVWHSGSEACDEQRIKELIHKVDQAAKETSLRFQPIIKKWASFGSAFWR